MKYNLILMMLVTVIFSDKQIVAQHQAIEDSLELVYQQRILKSRIDGTYIPKDFEDAFVELKRLSDPQDLKTFAGQEEEEVAKKLHFGLGRWMVVNWYFYEGSRFSHYIRQKGVSFPDDMAQLVMRLFHRHLNDRPLMEDELIAIYSGKRKDEHQKLLDDAETIERRKRKE